MAYTTIKKPSDYFNTVLYTGNGSTQSITGVGFQPDMLWGKNRSSVTNHELTDVVRGINQRLKPNDTDADQTNTNTFTSFDSDGFSLGTDADVNASGANHVVWSWKANGTGVSNTVGDINSTVSVNTTSGFSIVQWTGNGTAGSTVGHGLGSEMKFMILKDYSLSRSWLTYHHSLGNQSGINFNESGVAGTGNNAYWNSTSPTSNVFSTGVYSNENNSNYICYCFSEVKGFSKFGSYIGNGSTDGTFCFTGFKPAFIIVKRTDSTGSWLLMDNKRDTFNVCDAELLANDSFQETLATNLDILSNGFKLRTTGGEKNSSGGSYIYMAFAEEPLVGDNPATAR